MLNDYYKLYRDRADIIEDWQTANKNDLCNQYITEEDNTLKDAYMAAIICRYWSALCSSYQQSYMAATEEDAYDWFISSILYVLNNHVWTNPSSKVYGDPNGPDKCINIKIKCARLTFFQQNNRYNRKLNHGVESLEKLADELGDAAAPSSEDQVSDNEVYYNWIRREYLNMNYLNALTLDLIISSDVFNDYSVDTAQAFSIQKLIKQIKNIDEKYYNYFAREYDLVPSEVEQKFIRFKSAPKKVLQENIEFFFQTLGKV